MAAKQLKRLIDDLKKDPKLVENFKGAGHDTAAFVSKAKSLGYDVQQQDVSDYVEQQKKALGSAARATTTGAVLNAAVVVSTGPSPIIYAPAELVVVLVGPNPTLAVVANAVTTAIA